jgi:hypothetical protein
MKINEDLRDRWVLTSPGSPGGMPVWLPGEPCLAYSLRAAGIAPHPEWYRSPKPRWERAFHGRSPPSDRLSGVIPGVSGWGLRNFRKTLSANDTACRVRGSSSGLVALTRHRRKTSSCPIIPGFSMSLLAPSGLTHHRGKKMPGLYDPAWSQ